MRRPRSSNLRRGKLIRFDAAPFGLAKNTVLLDGSPTFRERNYTNFNRTCQGLTELSFPYLSISLIFLDLNIHGVTAYGN